MRKILTNFLIIILCLVLCLNFIRYLIMPDDYSTVSVLSVLDAISELGADPTPVFNSFGKMLQVFDDVLSDWELWKFDFTNVNTTLGTIKSILLAFSRIPERLAGIIATFVPLLKDVVVFCWEFLTSIYKFLNLIVGTNLDPGGFGGRR